MSIIYNTEKNHYNWEQHSLWTKSIFWSPQKDLSDQEVQAALQKKKRLMSNTAMLEAAILSEKVVMYTINDCILSKTQTEILATLLPTELLVQDDLEGKTRSYFVGVLMFGDVSGFTALCEKYFAEGGKGGTYKLTATLNCYIGAMVDVIYSYGGDIIKFSGDAFLAVWKVTISEYVYDVIHKVIVCAMYIQYSLGSFTTDAGVLLKVKLAISAGNVVFSSIGEEASKYYVIYGVPIDDVKDAQDTCVSGDVVLAPSAWGYCSEVNYMYTMKDEKHVKILRILYNPMQKTRKLYKLPPRNIVDLEKKYRLQLSKYKQMESDTDLVASTRETVRPEVSAAADRQIGPYLRPYLIPPVVAQVDAEQPLEYLTEMRQVITVFIDVVIKKRGTIATIDRVDEVYTQIWQVVHKQMGVVNKVCMFDKDIMFLVIFGLRGAHHEYNALKSLKCAYTIRSVVTQIHDVLHVSCGVTVGMTYCGVVGHPLRQEYTVIGAPVNKAARLMMYFPNKVTCDLQTCYNSGLSSIYFIEQEQKYLKGIGTVGGIYEYHETKRMGTVNIRYLPPLLGQDQEVENFKEVLQGAEGFPIGVLYSGTSGVGKSRLLEEFMILSVHGNQLRPVCVRLQANHTSLSYFVIQQIFKEIFGTTSDDTMETRQDIVWRTLAGTEYVQYVYLLNMILNLNFPERLPAEVYSFTAAEIKMLRDRVFRKLVSLACVDIVIYIDNVECSDLRSAELYPIFLQEGSAVLVMTVVKKHLAKPRRWFKTVRLIIYQLENIDEEFISPLACQILNVRAISVELHELLTNQVDMNAGWYQRYLQSLQESKVIKIDKIPFGELEQMKDMILPDEKYLRKRTIGQEFKPMRITFVSNNTEVEMKETVVSICTMQSTGEDGLEAMVPASIEAIIMSAFDCLSPYEQLLLKCGSAIGDTFSREMLHAVLFKRSPKETAQAIRRLFEMKVLTCANAETFYQEVMASPDSKSLDTSISIISRDFDICCYCKERTIHDDFEDSYILPYYAFCNEIKFTVPLFRCKTYDLLPLNQKILFHTRIAAFLEMKLHPPEHLKYGQPRYWQLLLKVLSDLLDVKEKEKEGASDKHRGPICIKELLIFRSFPFQPNMYLDIIHHYDNAGLKVNQLTSVIEYSLASLLAGCTRRAVSALQLATALVVELQESPLYKDRYDFNSIRARLFIISAQSYLDMRYVDLAKFELNKARVHLFRNRFAHLFSKYTTPHITLLSMARKSGKPFSRLVVAKQSEQCVVRVHYLNVASNINMVQNNWYKAKGLSLEATKILMKTPTLFVSIICDTFTNLIDIYNHLGKFHMAKRAHTRAMYLLSNFNIPNTDLTQQLSMCRLQAAINLSSFLQGKLEECARNSGKLLTLSEELGTADASLFLVTILLNCQMRLQRIKEYETTMESLKSNLTHNLAKVHYLMQCTLLHLYTGVIIRPVKDLYKLVEMRKIPMSRPVVIILGLYFERRNELTEVGRYKNLLERMVPPREITKYNVHYEIMYFEYHLIKLVRKIDSGDDGKTDLMDEMLQMQKLCYQLLQVIGEYIPHLLPRLYLLMAYMYQIQDQESSVNHYIKKALHLSSAYGDAMEYEWITCNKQNWVNFTKAKAVADNVVMIDMWSGQGRANQVMWSDFEKYKPGDLMYTLPLPVTFITDYADLIKGVMKMSNFHA